MNKFLRAVTLLTSLCLCFFVGCNYLDPCRQMEGRDDFVNITKNSYGDNTKIQSKFSPLPVDKQIDVFLYAENCTNYTSMRTTLAEDGEKKIPVIVERIKRESLKNKSALIGVLVAINTKCRCINKDSDVVRTLEDVEKQVNSETSDSDDYKESYSQVLKILEEQLSK